MSALLIGFVIVVVSAALFGAALFGRRPVPQPAMATDSSTRDAAAGAETAPSRFPSGKLTVARLVGVDSPVLIQAPAEPDHLSSADVRVPTARRVRSAILLTVSMLGAAMLIGAILSIVVVGAVLLVA